MQGISEKLLALSAWLDGLVWGPFMMALMIGAGVWLSVCTGFPQFRRFGQMLRVTLGSAFSGKKEKGALSPFQAVSTALAGTVGTGNIAGIAGAVALGGPGAVFWMWFSALWGMATKYAEVLLAVKFRERNAVGEWVGGPMYTIINGLGKKYRPLAAVFSLFGMCAAFGIGNMAQVNTISSAAVALSETLSPGSAPSFEIRLAVGLAVAVAVALVLLGGVGRIGAVAERLVPAMSLFYIVGAMTVIVQNSAALPEVLRAIFGGAFCPQAVLGGAAGIGVREAVRLGVGRGVFSNEAGLGSAPIAHATTSETDPARQALFGIFEVFVDTIVICTLTALAILTSGVSIPYGRDAGAELTIAAFASAFGGRTAGTVIALCIVFFALSSILSWSLYGSRCAEFLFGQKVLTGYRLVFVVFIVLGAVSDLALAWNISNTLNGLMAIPNLIAVLALSGVIRRECKK